MIDQNRISSHEFDMCCKPVFCAKIAQKSKNLVLLGNSETERRKNISICDANYSGIHRVINFFLNLFENRYMSLCIRK